MPGIARRLALTDVYFMPAAANEGPYTIGAKIARMYDLLGLTSRLPRGALVAVKVSLGAGGAAAPLAAPWIRPVVDRLAAAGAQPFLTEGGAAYAAGRGDAVRQLKLAATRGFTLEAVGAPFMVADGLQGEAVVEVPIAGRHYDRVEVAAAAAKAAAIVNVSSLRGHAGAVLTAAIASLGLGLASRDGWRRQQMAVPPTIDPAHCGGCGVCVAACGQQAISHDGARAAIAAQLCNACGECLGACYFEAIRRDHAAHTRLLQERMAEHALGAVSGKLDRLACLTFLLRVTSGDGGFHPPGPPLFPDLGLMAASDPVAADQACCDLVARRTGRSLEAWCGLDYAPQWQLAHGEAIGLGSRHYRLREVAPD